MHRCNQFHVHNMPYLYTWIIYFFINSVDWNMLAKLLTHYLYTRSGWYDKMLLLLQEITSHYAFVNALWGSRVYVEHCKLLKEFSASCTECEGNSLMNKILWSWLNIWFLQFGTTLLVHCVFCNLVARLSKTKGWDTHEVLGKRLQALCCIFVVYAHPRKTVTEYDVRFVFFLRGHFKVWLNINVFKKKKPALWEHDFVTFSVV